MVKSPHRGLAQVTNWVNLKFAAMNLKSWQHGNGDICYLRFALLFFRSYMFETQSAPDHRLGSSTDWVMISNSSGGRLTIEHIDCFRKRVRGLMQIDLGRFNVGVSRERRDGFHGNALCLQRCHIGVPAAMR